MNKPTSLQCCANSALCAVREQECLFIWPGAHDFLCMVDGGEQARGQVAVAHDILVDRTALVAVLHTILIRSLGAPSSVHLYIVGHLLKLHLPR